MAQATPTHAKHHRYNVSDKGRTRSLKYELTENGAARRARYETSHPGRSTEWYWRTWYNHKRRLRRIAARREAGLGLLGLGLLRLRERAS